MPSEPFLFFGNIFNFLSALYQKSLHLSVINVNDVLTATGEGSWTDWCCAPFKPTISKKY